METVELSVLVRRAADGDQEAWNAIVRAYTRLVWSVVRRFCLRDDQAADAVQATWLRLIEHIGSVRDPDRLPGWLRTTAHRACIELIRTAGREVPAHLHDDAAPLEWGRTRTPVPDDPEASALRTEHRHLVRAALRQLPPRDRSLFALLLASPPLSYEEIGRRLGMPVGSIGPTRARALGRLHAALEDVGLHDMALG
jgi:RNA polymerase sigma factor (sigma-70 family)